MTTGRLVDDVQLPDRYRQVRLLGEGGSKRVHLVHDRRLDRDLVACTARSPEGDDRLRHEATVLAQLSGAPRVVEVHDLLELDRPVMLCRHVPGGTLQSRMRDDRVDVGTAVALAVDVVTALQSVHGAGLLHRDVEPGNVWLDAGGRAVLGDFDLAVGISPPPAEPLVGTPLYAAPEQLCGECCDERSDLWSLGAVLYELLTGRPPVARGAPVDVVARTLTARPCRPSLVRPEVPPHLDGIVLRLLALDPRDRPVSADAALAALTRPTRTGAASATAGVTGPADGFVGRAQELGELSRALAEAARGRGGLTLLIGDAGVGKTRTVLELARRAQLDGWTVLTARCPEDAVAPPYWPWTQVLRAALRATRGTDLADADKEVVAPLLPELEPGEAIPESSRFRLFDAVVRLLRRTAAERPLLLLLDDVHWVDPASLSLAAHVARELRTDRVAIVACTRPDEDGTKPSRSLTALSGAATATLHLHGLSLAETGRFLETLDVGPDRLLVKEIHERTDGNPFHVAELVRLLQAETGLTPAGLVAAEHLAPTGLRDVLHRRLDQVPPDCRELLQSMAVVGREAGLPVLAGTSGLRTSRVLHLLERAVAHRLVLQVAEDPPRFRFTHALVRESLYDSLSAVRRAELHRRATETLLQATPREHEAPAAELAHHAVRAAAHGDATPAVLWSMRAGRAASLAAAYEDAVLHLGRAVDLAGDLALPSGDGSVPSFGELLLELGDAQRALGQSEQARLTFLRAAGHGITDEDPELLARSALGYGLGLGGFGYVDRADGVLLSLLEEALVALGEQDTPLRVRVLARLATELHFTPFRRRRLALSREAVEVAQRVGDRSCELVATYSRTLALLGPEHLDEQRRTADRVVWLAEEQADPDMAFRGHHLRLMVALEAGALEQAASEVTACRRIADAHRQAAHDWHARVFEAMLVLAEGRHDDALQLADVAFQAGSRSSPQMAQVMHGAQVLVARWGQGRLSELVDVVRAFADDYPHAPAWRATLAFCCTETGRPDEARRELEVLAARSFADLPEDGNYLVTAALLAHVAARLGDVSRARLLEARLRPYADRRVVIAAGAVVFGSVRLPLGVARAACGDLDGAVRELTAAHRLHQESGMPALVVWCAEELARVLLARGRARDLTTCREVLDSALPAAAELGMTPVQERLKALAGECDRQAVGLPTGADGDQVTVLISDVAASTSLTEALGESAVQAMLAQHRGIVETSAAAEGGVVLKAIGDAVLVALPSADAAVRCATRLQQRVEATESPLHARIGVHTGPVLRRGDSMYGRTMIVAFRIADVAPAGAVLVSGATRAAVRTEVDFDAPRSLRLKGLERAQEVSALRWRTEPRCHD